MKSVMVGCGRCGWTALVAKCDAQDVEESHALEHDWEIGRADRKWS